MNGNRVIDTERYNIGSGKNGNNAMLKKAVKSGMEHILEKHGITPKAVIVSGMITSDGGLCEIPHITAPAGVKELHNAISVRNIPEI